MQHPKLNQEDIEHLSRYITHNEKEEAINSLQDMMDSLLNSTRSLKKRILAHIKLFHEIERDGTLHFIKPVLYSSQNQTRTHAKKRTTSQSP
jgi:hypothetical protein